MKHTGRRAFQFFTVLLTSSLLMYCAEVDVSADALTPKADQTKPPTGNPTPGGDPFAAESLSLGVVGIQCSVQSDCRSYLDCVEGACGLFENAHYCGLLCDLCDQCEAIDGLFTATLCYMEEADVEDCSDSCMGHSGTNDPTWNVILTSFKAKTCVDFAMILGN